MRSAGLPAAATLCGFSLSLLTACPNREVSRLDPVPDQEEFKDIPVNINRKLDILFVVDDSLSMDEEQANLQANFTNFTNVLETIEGGLPDIHLGVVSSNVGSLGQLTAPCDGFGDNGALQVGGGASCNLGAAKFISDVSDGGGGRIRNYDMNMGLGPTFACVADLGVAGCGLEQHLESMKRALDGNGSNAGFLRDDAYLAVVFLADEDDCSAYNPDFYSDDPSLGVLSSFRCFEYGVTCAEAGSERDLGPRTNCEPEFDSDYLTNPDEYVTFLKGLKENPRDVIVATIIGNPSPVAVGEELLAGQNDESPAIEPSCSYDPAGAAPESDADPGVRLDYFRRQFPDRNTFTTICDEDLSDGLTVIAELLKEVIGNPCIDGDLVDTNPTIDGEQYECVVKAVYNEGDSNEMSETLPPCGGSTPCWQLVPDPMNCAGSPTELAIDIDWGGPDPADTNVKVRCAVQ